MRKDRGGGRGTKGKEDRRCVEDHRDACGGIEGKGRVEGRNEEKEV